MAQPSNKESVNNWLADSTDFFQQQYQNLDQQANQQQTQFNTNHNSTQLLQNNLLTPNLNTNNNNNNTNNNNNNIDDESKTNISNISNISNDIKQMSHQMEAVKIKQSGIERNREGDVTITHGNKELKANYYQSSEYKDFRCMSSILRAELLDGCDKMNFQYPSKIQAEAIPRCLDGKNNEYPNLIGQAHNGAGKTATFTLIMLQRIDENSDKLQGLVVVHSRELAIQTYSVFSSLGQFIQGLKMTLALPGENLNKSWTAQICIGTPGTIIGKIFNAQKRTQQQLKGFLSQFKILVVDEADEFLKAKKQRKSKRRGASSKNSFGSLFDQLKMITTDITSNVGINKFQSLLFSATYPQSIKYLAHEIAANALEIKVAQKEVQLDNIRIFRVQCVDEVDKFNTLLRVISLANIGQMIIFVNTVNKAKQLIDGLESNELGIACSALYGKGMEYQLRDKTMQQFRKNQTQCLVASNVIARGIDVPAVGLVVNFEIPISANFNYNHDNHNQKLTFDSETFMHRVGRTGRFGAKGVCINLVANNDKNGNHRLDGIQKEYSLKMNVIDNSAKAIKETITSWLAQS